MVFINVVRLCSPGTVESTLFFLVCVHSYTLRVVGNGIKAQAANPEVKVKGADSVIHQIIDKLKHINQVGLVALRIETLRRGVCRFEPLRQ